MPHRIRLRKPWHRIETPGGAVWRRPFNRPTGLGPADRVWVVVEGLERPGSVELNGRTLGRLDGEGAAERFDATGSLELHNELVLRLDGAGAREGPPSEAPPAEVCLEIVPAPH